MVILRRSLHGKLAKSAPKVQLDVLCAAAESKDDVHCFADNIVTLVSFIGK